MPSPRRLIVTLLLVACGGAALVVALPAGRNAAWAAFSRLRGRVTVEERLAQLPDASLRAAALCTAAGAEFPPESLLVVADKRGRAVHLVATDDGRRLPLAAYPILGASGELGPKLREGDMQVPEGIYPIESLNPNSRFHLSLRVGYPNEFDRARAAEDGRDRLGGDIMIHGGSASIGCIAIGDPAIEELFALVAAIGVEKVRVAIVPSLDPRVEDAPPGAPAWLPELYATLRAELSAAGLAE